MSEDLPVQGTILSSSPCTVKDAASLLGKFLQSESVPDSGLLRGYLESVSNCLEELASRRPPKRKERKSSKHSGVDHQISDVREHATTSGLNSEAVSSGVKQHNGHQKGSGKKRKELQDDGEDNEQFVKWTKHWKRKDIGDVIGNDAAIIVEKSRKKRKEDGADVEDHVHSVRTKFKSQRNDDGMYVDSDEPGSKQKHHQKRKDRGVVSETDKTDIREKFKRNVGDIYVDSNEPSAEKKHHKKRKDRGLDSEIETTDIREKKRKKRIEQ